MGCDGSRVLCCIHEIGQRIAESCSGSFGYKRTSQLPKEYVERQGSASPTASGITHQKGKSLSSVLLYRNFSTFLQLILPHVLHLSGAPTSFSVVWKDHASRQSTAEGKTTNKLGFTARREEVHLPLCLCVSYCFTPAPHGFVSY